MVAEDEIFACHFDVESTIDFTYREIIDFILEPDLLWQFNEVKSYDDLNELLKYMRKFVRDVNSHYGTGT